jgi:hypothetical protein
MMRMCYVSETGLICLLAPVRHEETDLGMCYLREDILG